MFGQNPVRGYEEHPEGKLQVHEIFYTLQGEGPFVGRPAVFIRLSGCNLRCHFCDTKWDDEGDKWMAVDDIVEKVLKAPKMDKFYKFKKFIVVITGGEPLRQPLDQLLKFLIEEHNLHVQIETAGTLWQECLDRHSFADLTVVVSPKTPTINAKILHRATAFKYVVKASEYFTIAGIPVSNTQIGGRAPKRLASHEGYLEPEQVYLSPCDEYDEEKNAANKRLVAELALYHGFTAGIQLHKVLNLP